MYTVYPAKELLLMPLIKYGEFFAVKCKEF